MDHNEAAQLAGDIVKAESLHEGRIAVQKYAGGLAKIVKELALLAYYDPDDHVEIAEGGEMRFRSFKEQGKKRRALKKIKEKTVIGESKDGSMIFKKSTVEFEGWDKKGALEELLSLGGYYPAEKKDVKHSGGVALYKPTEAEETELREIAAERSRKAIEALNE